MMVVIILTIQTHIRAAINDGIQVGTKADNDIISQICSHQSLAKT
jgi:hypothetical protein